MKIRSIGSLFASQQSAVGLDSEVREKSQTTEVQKPRRSEEAARVSVISGGDESPEDRAKRVSDLKNKVASGGYNPLSTDVARAVARDLL